MASINADTTQSNPKHVSKDKLFVKNMNMESEMFETKSLNNKYTKEYKPLYIKEVS